MAVGAVSMSNVLKNRIRFAATSSTLLYPPFAVPLKWCTIGLTVGGHVVDDEASVDLDRTLLMLKGDGVCMTAEAVRRFVEVHIVVCAFQCPESANT